jgi:CubicO group peptidase (beta-lactamase class C family)
MAKWNAALDGDALLHAQTKDMMWTPARLNDGQTVKYGFGWFLESVEGHRNIGHSGATSGFSASIQRFPDDNLAIILLTNTDEQIATTLARRVAAFYFASPATGK